MKLPTGIRVLCLCPKKKEEITGISTLSLTVHCLAQRKNWENISRPICWQLSNIWKHILVADHLYQPQANSRRGFKSSFQSMKMSLKKICFMQIHKPSLNRGLCRHHWSLYPHLLKLYNCDNRIALCRYYDILPIAPTAICLLDTNAYLLSKHPCIVSSHRKYYINDPDQALSHWQWKICPI